jgi:hypothetical protein
VPTKQDHLDELADLLGLVRVHVYAGSSLPAPFFKAAAETAGVSTAGGMPEIAERVILKAGLPWSPAYDSRHTPSGGGSTVTRAGIAALVQAVQILTGQIPPRPGFLLTWNPEQWSWLDHGLTDAIAASEAGQIVEEPWSTGSRTGGIQDGDRVFLLRQGAEPRGIVASGIARGPVYQAGHWSGQGGIANYIDVDFDCIIDPDQPLPTGDLKAAIPSHNWRPQGSGTILPSEVLSKVEQMWSAHVDGSPAKPMGGAGKGQSRLMDAERRKKVEDSAQERLMKHYEDLGWDVEDMHIGNPFDARATKDGKTLYLEAKGTTSSGQTVIVTRGEVEWALAHPGEHVVGILSGVLFDKAGEIVPGSGDFRIVEFKPKKSQLDPIAYDWSVPSGNIHH